MKKVYQAALFLIVLAGCGTNSHKEHTTNMKTADPHSYAQPTESKVTHLNWDAEVNFDTKDIHATAVLTLENSADADELVLDIRGLLIEKVTLDDNEDSATYQIGEEDKYMGSSLTVNITPEIEKVTIVYRTAPDAEALQWLTPVQTAGKKQPFLFTQSQAILARSWVPIQDSPGLRFTYEARVKVPTALLALMSAENPTEKNSDGVYHFKMEQPIPAYLLALTVGDLSFEALGPRSGVYAEPSMLERAAYEFAELPDMLKAAEELYGEYKWEQYDIVVLPPSFPFGGMENPRLTFATPTILAGDRSLTSLIAHELAHSWSGNLVTNATWSDFWLNEGFTVYFEQRIMEKLYGRDYSEMLASLAAQDLRSEVDDMIEKGNEKDTRLKLELEGRNPDDGVTSIAYDKGYLFLRYLEELVGRERFDEFLKNYFERNAFKVITTEEFVKQLNKYLIKPERVNLGKVKIKEWLYHPGLPSDAPLPASDKFNAVSKEMQRFMAGTPADTLDTVEWSSHEWQHFIREIPDSISLPQMRVLDEAFGFTSSGNAEVLSAWLQKVIVHQYEPAYDELETFLIHTGRRKFLTPLYGELIKTEKGREMANKIYSKARPNYHFVSTNTIDEMLKWQTTN